MDNCLKVLIDRQEGDFWVLKLSEDQELFWPKNKTNLFLTIGESINLCLTKNEIEKINQEEKAKNLLKQIFQPNV